MAQQGPLPFLEFCGTEVANAARTIDYLRNGLGDTQQGHWELSSKDLCGVLYRLNNEGVASGCAPTVFVSPADDPAPWYDAEEPGSSSFLGVVMLDIKGYDSVIERPITQTLSPLGGGVFGSERRKPREWKFRAALISNNDTGAEFGLRWLTDVLSATQCDICSTCWMTVRLSCPLADCSDDEQGEWISYGAALTDGPHEVQQYSPGAIDDVMGGCRDFVIVEWTMVAANPLLYKRPRMCYDIVVSESTDCTDICSFLFGGAGSAHCCTVTPPRHGTLGAIFTMFSQYGAGACVLEMYEDCDDLTTPLASIRLASIPAGSTLVVDSSQHVIQEIDVDGNISDATNLVELQIGSGIQWLEIEDCDTAMCFCLRFAQPCVGGTIDVLLETQVREG